MASSPKINQLDCQLMSIERFYKYSDLGQNFWQKREQKILRESANSKQKACPIVSKIIQRESLSSFNKWILIFLNRSNSF